MFSSATNNNTSTTSLNIMSPFPHYYFPSSSYSSPQNYLPQVLPPPPPPPPQTTSFSQEDLFFHQNHHHHYDPTTFLLQNIPETPLNLEPSVAGDFSRQGHVAAIQGLSPRTKKPAPKKDRHSKIFTAQGLRDRRVRLSIEIAREFFDLHDMLGFDKASKTLEWLLRKSKKAIQELSTNTNLRASKSLSSNNSDQTLDEPTAMPSEPSIVTLLAKQSRAKARARARARTKDKTNNNHCPNKNKIADKCGSSSQISTQFRTNTAMNSNHFLQGGFDAEFASRFEPCPLRVGLNQNKDQDHSDVVLTKRASQYSRHFRFPFPWSSSSSGEDRHQQELKTTSSQLGDASVSNNVVLYSSSSLLLQNWDFNSTVSPRLCVPMRTNP